MSRDIKYKAVMQRNDGVMYVSQPYSIDNSLSYLFDFENNRWDKFIEMITTEERFVELFPDDDEYLKGWTHNENIQYTGLKDKNGKEIYEGDVVIENSYPFFGNAPEITDSNQKCNELNYVGVVVWNDGYYVDLKAISNRVRGSAIGNSLYDYTELEVIGNIYEDSHLLDNN